MATSNLEVKWVSVSGRSLLVSGKDKATGDLFLSKVGSRELKEDFRLYDFSRAGFGPGAEDFLYDIHPAPMSTMSAILLFRSNPEIKLVELVAPPESIWESLLGLPEST